MDVRELIGSPYTNRFIETEELFADHNVAFQDTLLLPPDTYTHVKLDRLSTSRIDPIAVSLLLCCWIRRVRASYCPILPSRITALQA